jgi:hypothetical protein
MLYSHMDLWTGPDGNIWHALFRPGTRDLSMGVLLPHEVGKVLAWASRQRMTVTDTRS